MEGHEDKQETQTSQEYTEWTDTSWDHAGKWTDADWRSSDWSTDSWTDPVWEQEARQLPSTQPAQEQSDPAHGGITDEILVRPPFGRQGGWEVRSPRDTGTPSGHPWDRTPAGHHRDTRRDTGGQRENTGQEDRSSNTRDQFARPPTQLRLARPQARTKRFPSRGTPFHFDLTSQPPIIPQPQPSKFRKFFGSGKIFDESH